MFFVFFSVFRFWMGIWGVFRGVFWGSEGFCILYGGPMIARLRLLFLGVCATENYLNLPKIG